MSDPNKNLDLNTLEQMRDILDRVWMECDDPNIVREEIDKVITLITEWVKELEDDS